MQLIPATSGSVVLDGEDLSALSASEVRKRRLDFQMVFQDPYASLNPRMTIFSTLAEAVRQRRPNLKGDALFSRVETLMATVGLDAKVMRKYPHEFSGGQRQRIAIARALAPEPKLIVADEPVSALDVSIQAQVLNLLMDLQAQYGLAYLFISHDLGVVRHIADEVMVMYCGRPVEHGPKASVFATPRHPYTRMLLAATPSVDPTQRKTHLTIKGELPSPLNPPPGCAFASRCPHATSLCTEERPEPRLLEGHLIACHHAEVIG